MSIFIFSSDHPKNLGGTIEFDHTPPKSTMANRLALSSPILDDAIKRYSQNKTKKSQNTKTKKKVLELYRLVQLGQVSDYIFIWDVYTYMYVCSVHF